MYLSLCNFLIDFFSCCSVACVVEDYHSSFKSINGINVLSIYQPLLLFINELISAASFLIYPYSDHSSFTISITSKFITEAQTADGSMIITFEHVISDHSRISNSDGEDLVLQKLSSFIYLFVKTFHTTKSISFYLNYFLI